MLLRFLRTTGTQIILFIIFLGSLFWALPLPNTGKEVLSVLPPMPLYKFCTFWATSWSFGGTLLTFLLVMFQAFWLVRLNTVFIIINNRTYLPAFFFVLTIAAFPGNLLLQPAVFGALFLIFAIGRILEAYRSNSLAHEIFQASFFLSLGSLFYAPLVFFEIIVWIGLVLLRPFRWREWVFTVLGFITPLFLAFSYYYLIKDDWNGLFLDYLNFFTTSVGHIQLLWNEFLVVGTLLFVLFMASQHMVASSQNQKILPRKAFKLYFWLFALIVVVYIFIPQAALDLVYLASIPISFLFGQYFSAVKAERWANFLLMLLLGTVLLSRVSVFI